MNNDNVWSLGEYLCIQNVVEWKNAYNKDFIYIPFAFPIMSRIQGRVATIG